MSVFTISCILTTASTFLMAVLIFLKHERKKSTIIWGFFCLMAAIWGLGGILFSTARTMDTAYVGWKVAYLGAVFAPPIFYHFVCVYLGLNQRIGTLIAYTAAGIYYVLVAFFPKVFFGELVFLFDELYYIYWPKDKSPVYLFFYISFYWFLLSYFFLFLVIHLKRATGLKRQQIKYLIAGSLIGWLGAHGDFLAAFGLNVYPYSNFLIAVYPLVIGYAIIRHQLMDINIVIKKSIVYSLSITIISITFLVSVLIFERIFSSILKYDSTYGSILAAVFIAIIFTPLKNKIQYLVDRIIYKGSQEEIARQNELLRQEVARAERYKTLATLTKGIVNEIKSPLTAITGYSHFVKEKHNDPEFLNKFVTVLGMETKRMNALIQHLTEYSDPTPLTKEQTDIVRLINGMVAFLKTELIEKGISLDKDFPSRENTELYIDPAQIKQALLNIIMNAIEAMPEGGKLWIGGSRTEDHFRIAIKDSGAGIPKEVLAKIFDPFYTTKEGHTGLGLSITQGIIENHKGRILVKSQAGLGTEVIIELPCKEQR